MKHFLKKSGCILLSALLLSTALVGCGETGMDSSSTNSHTDLMSSSLAESQTSSSQTFQNSDVAYKAFLKDLYDTSSEKERADTSYYIRDLDNNGVDELIIKTPGEYGISIAIYRFQNHVTKIDSFDTITGTSRFFLSDNPVYPGIFTFHVGGGLERYNYITLKDNALSFEKLWDDDFSGITQLLQEDRPKIVEYITDKQMIAESKKLYQENKDIVFLPLESVLN